MSERSPDAELQSPDDRVTVDLDAERCIGVGSCELLQPDHFRVDDDTAVAVLIGDGTMARADGETVVDRCPSGALSIATGSGQTSG